MRAFIVFMLLVMVALLFVNGSLRGLDLTSNTPSTVQAAAPEQAPQVAPQVITIQESPSISVVVDGPIPVTGECSDPYTVQPGDSLLQIAENCNTTLVAIRQANPEITNANLIYPGQQLRIPGAAASLQPTLVVPVTGDQASLSTPIPQQTLPAQTANPVQVSPTAIVPATGAYPLIAAGTGLEVRGIDYPPNTPVNIAIGAQTQGYTPVANGVTDASGTVTVHINVPEAQNAQEPYVVVIATTGTPPVQAMSQPFLIGPAGSTSP